MGAVLGVPTLSYAPWAVFNYASPGLGLLYGFTGFKIEKVEPHEEQPVTVRNVIDDVLHDEQASNLSSQPHNDGGVGP
jgi:Na+/H+ antiporter NhaC